MFLRQHSLALQRRNEGRMPQVHTEVNTWVCGTLPFFRVYSSKSANCLITPILELFIRCPRQKDLSPIFPIVFSKAQQSNHHSQPLTERPLRGSSEALHCPWPGYVVWLDLNLRSVISPLQTAGGSVKADIETQFSLVGQKKEGRKDLSAPRKCPWIESTFQRGATAADLE